VEPSIGGCRQLKLNRRRLSELGWKWPETRYALASWLIPLLYATIAYLIVWIFGLGGFPSQEFMEHLVGTMGLHAPPAVSTIVYLLLVGSVGLIHSIGNALGEEIGWRGFLVPELFKTAGFTGTALISGLIWSFWHYPVLIGADYNAGTPTWYGLTCFTVMVVSASFIFTWMRLKSGSLWVGALLHASHNFYVQHIFTPLTRKSGYTPWLIDEFGAVLPIEVNSLCYLFLAEKGRIAACGCPASKRRKRAELIPLGQRLQDWSRPV
jgi:CAAX protease family protein